MQKHGKTRKRTKQTIPSRKVQVEKKVLRQRSQTDNSGQGKLLKPQNQTNSTP
jgi:hypothetical protein